MRRTFSAEEATVTAFSSRMWKRTVVVPTSSAATYFMVLICIFFQRIWKFRRRFTHALTPSQLVIKSNVKCQTLDRGVRQRLVSINTCCILSTSSSTTIIREKRRNALRLAMAKNVCYLDTLAYRNTTVLECVMHHTCSSKRSLSRLQHASHNKAMNSRQFCRQWVGRETYYRSVRCISWAYVLPIMAETHR